MVLNVASFEAGRQKSKVERERETGGVGVRRPRLLINFILPRALGTV